ncbi:MAG: hypothetical protein KatS3mg110_0906 [Pirellulaceae bacterium]|nr:MAG: hypothetical protein KatS3mg110_0906 [Pirellulaceae bacterium]
MDRRTGSCGSRREFLRWSAALLGTAGVWSTTVWAQERGALREPVYRISKADVEPSGQHPLDPALQMAHEGLQRIRSQIRDYTCILVKRERIKNELSEHQYIFTKIRHRQYDQGQLVVPFSVYMYFLKPADIKGREVIYVEGRNNGKLCAHEGGRRGSLLPSVWLNPDSPLALQDSRYPITDVGIENLVLKLIERGQRERQFPDVDVAFKKNARVNDRVCTVLEIRHPQRRPEYDFYFAQIFIDDQLGVPIRYAAYGWPEGPQGEAPVLEEYTYMQLKVNVGLTDDDFDPNNKNYNF